MQWEWVGLGQTTAVAHAQHVLECLFLKHMYSINFLIVATPLLYACQQHLLGHCVLLHTQGGLLAEYFLDAHVLANKNNSCILNFIINKILGQVQFLKIHIKIAAFKYIKQMNLLNQVYNWFTKIDLCAKSVCMWASHKA